jgi:hypothetical protein
MTTPVIDAVDLLSIVANIKDPGALQLVSRVLQAHTAVMESQLAQFKQLQGALQEKISGK